MKKNVQDIIIPSEEDHIEMFPLDFEEFLWAMGDEATYPLIRHCFEAKKPMGAALHRKIMNDFRQYILVGGMPQSVLSYINGKDFEASDIAKRLRITAPAVSKMLRSMEEKGYVERRVDEKDRRNTRVSITPDGKEAEQQVRRQMQEFITGVIERLGEERTKELIHLMNRYTEIMQEENQNRKRKKQEEKHEANL